MQLADIIMIVHLFLTFCSFKLCRISVVSVGRGWHGVPPH